MRLLIGRMIQQNTTTRTKTVLIREQLREVSTRNYRKMMTFNVLFCTTISLLRDSKNQSKLQASWCLLV